ncbi:MAG TPA: CHASE3 domain-containing protein, partial [Myxococcota bacterium]
MQRTMVMRMRSMASSSFANRRRVPVPILFALAGGMLAILFTGLSSWRALGDQQDASAVLGEVTAVGHRLERHQALLLRAEADQRGYLLSGDDAHRRAFEAAAQAVEGEMALLSSSRWSAAQQHRADELQRLTRLRLDELRTTMEQRRKGEELVDPALGAVDQGRVVMEQVRAVLLAMQQEQADVVARERGVLDAARAETRSTLAFGSAVLLALFAAAAVLLVRDSLQRNRETWLRDGEAGVAVALIGDKRADELARAVITFLADYTGAAVGAFYAGPSADTLTLRGGFSLADDKVARIVAGHGVVGQVVLDARARQLDGIAARHLAVHTGTVASAPSSVLVVPTMVDGHVNGVVELAYLTALHGAELELLERASSQIGIGIKMAEYREQIGEQLSDSQAQAEQLQQQAARLEEQQNTLEAANTRLQAQTSTMAAQQQELGIAADALVEKNNELEKSSQYKSSFLAKTVISSLLAGLCLALT